jgi:hypothetical protein
MFSFEDKLSGVPSSTKSPIPDVKKQPLVLKASGSKTKKLIIKKNDSLEGKNFLKRI